MIEKTWVFPFSENQRDSFKTGELWRKWSKQFPDIFDEDDIRIVKTQHGRGIHYYEWLAAILMYETTGYMSLVEKYGFRKHRRKQEILRKLVTPDHISFIMNKPGEVQNPDLLVYSQSLTDWFFCEVKGPSDRLRKVQKEYFEELKIATGKPVFIIEFKSLGKNNPLF